MICIIILSLLIISKSLILSNILIFNYLILLFFFISYKNFFIILISDLILLRLIFFFEILIIFSFILSIIITLRPIWFLSWLISTKSSRILIIVIFIWTITHLRHLHLKLSFFSVKRLRRNRMTSSLIPISLSLPLSLPSYRERSHWIHTFFGSRLAV